MLGNKLKGAVFVWYDMMNDDISYMWIHWYTIYDMICDIKYNIYFTWQYIWYNIYDNDINLCIKLSEPVNNTLNSNNYCKHANQYIAVSW